MKNLIPAIIQDDQTNQVLMLAYMDEQARRLTEETGSVYFWSRSRKTLWMKGETSGNVLKVVSIVDDCDSDALLIRVNPSGPTCHTGSVSCFSDSFLRELECLIADRKEKMPKNSYTTYLFKKGVDKMTEKVEEEAEEVCRAAKSETKKRLTEESADLMYHLLVLLKEKDLSFEDVVEELKGRSA